MPLLSRSLHSMPLLAFLPPPSLLRLPPPFPPFLLLLLPLFSLLLLLLLFLLLIIIILLLLFFLLAASLRLTAPHLISSRTDNFSLLGFLAAASASLLSCRLATLPTSPSSLPTTFLLCRLQCALMRTSFSDYVFPPLPLLILLFLRFLLHLLVLVLVLVLFLLLLLHLHLLVSFIFMQW